MMAHLSNIPNPVPIWLAGFQRQVAAINHRSQLDNVIKQVLSFLEDNAPLNLIPPALTVGDDGSLQIEWHNKLVDLEIEFFSDREPEAYVWFHDEAKSTLESLADSLENTRVIRAIQKTVEASS